MQLVFVKIYSLWSIQLIRGFSKRQNKVIIVNTDYGHKDDQSFLFFCDDIKSHYLVVLFVEILINFCVHSFIISFLFDVSNYIFNQWPC
jgi:hypothetical protein